MRKPHVTRKRSSALLIAIPLCILCTGLKIYLWNREQPAEPESATEASASVPGATQAMRQSPSASAASARSPSAVASRTPAVRAPAAASSPAPPSSTPSATSFHDEYFRTELMKIPVVSEIHGSLIGKLPPGHASDLLALYVSEGPVRNGTPDFARFMSSLHAELRARSEELLSLLNSQDKVLKQDAFVYQMALNLAFQLEVTPESRAQVLGHAMDIPFTKDAHGVVSLMSANITNAFILMKNSGVTRDQAMPYIRKGLAANFGDADAVREFIARANAYYPGSI